MSVLRRIFFLGLVLCWFAGPVYGQSKKDREKAALLFEEASTSYKLQRYLEALEGFQQSYALSGEPSILFNIGQCQRQLGQLSEAQRSFQFFVRDAPTHPQRGSAERFIKELEVELARMATKGSLKISSLQDPTEVYMDGAFKGESPLVLLSVEPGARAIVIKKKGYADAALRVTVKPSETIELSIPQLTPSVALLPAGYTRATIASGGASALALGGFFGLLGRAGRIQDDGVLEDPAAEQALIRKRQAQGVASGVASLSFAIIAGGAFGAGVILQKRHHKKVKGEAVASQGSDEVQP